MEKMAKLETVIDNDNVRRIMAIAMEAGAFIRGEFILTSGKKSSYYFDARKLTLHPEGAYRVGCEISRLLSGKSIDAIGGVATGGYPMVTAAAIAGYLNGMQVPIFIVREVSKEHGTMRKIEGHLKDGSRVAIVEDVLTTGGSVLRAIQEVESMDCRVMRVIALVDRQEGGGQRLNEAGYEFTAFLKVIH